MAGTMGHQAQWAADDSTPVDSNSEPYEFVSESLAKQAEILDTEGIRGTRSHASERTRAGNNVIAGQIVFHPSPASLDKWLPRILGAAESADSFALAETLPAWVCCIDRGVDAFLYQGCVISKATFRGSAGQLVTLTLDVLATSETSGQTFPSLTLGTAANDAPYVMSDGTCSLQSGARNFTDFEIVIDNAAVARYLNSANPSDILLNDRIVTVGMNVPWISGNQALHDQAAAGATGTLTLTNGNMSTLFTFGVLQVPSKTPIVGGKGEILLNLEMVARKTGSTNELVVTHDSTA